MRESVQARRFAAAACVLVVLAVHLPAAAQSGDPNTGPITLSGTMDASNAYLFRGIPQDDTGLIMWPAIDVGLALSSRVTVNVGTWNSLHTGMAGLDGPSGKLWYESDFYTTFGLALGGGFAVGATYTAYTSPNNGFASVKELSFRLATDAHGTKPYALVAFELQGQADGGRTKGKYLEIGAAPGFGASGAAIAVPVKIGLSLDGYYEGQLGDERFGFFSVGANVTVPISSATSRFGSWNVHGGAEYIRLGDGNALRLGDNNKTVFSAGIGFSY
jgi:hypothetical protein